MLWGHRTFREGRLTFEPILKDLVVYLVQLHEDDEHQAEQDSSSWLHSYECDGRKDHAANEYGITAHVHQCTTDGEIADQIRRGITAYETWRSS
jgi:hypothetical protein